MIRLRPPKIPRATRGILLSEDRMPNSRLAPSAKNSPQGGSKEPGLRRGPLSNISRRTLQIWGQDRGLSGQQTHIPRPTCHSRASAPDRFTRSGSAMYLARAPEHPDARARRPELAAAGRVAGTGSRFLGGSAATGAAGGCFLATLSSRARAGIAGAGGALANAGARADTLARCAGAASWRCCCARWCVSRRPRPQRPAAAF